MKDVKFTKSPHTLPIPDDVHVSKSKQQSMMQLNNRLMKLLDSSASSNKTYEKSMMEMKKKYRSVLEACKAKEDEISALRADLDLERSTFTSFKIQSDRTLADMQQIQASEAGEKEALLIRLNETENRLTAASMDLNEHMRGAGNVQTQMHGLRSANGALQRTVESHIAEKTQLEASYKDATSRHKSVTQELESANKRIEYLELKLQDVAAPDYDERMEARKATEIRTAILEVRKQYDQRHEALQRQMEVQVAEILEKRRLSDETKDQAIKKLQEINDYAQALEQERTGYKLQLEDKKAREDELTALIIVHQDLKKEMAGLREHSKRQEEEIVELSATLLDVNKEREAERELYQKYVDASTEHIEQLEAALDSRNQTSEEFAQQIDQYTSIVEAAEYMAHTNSAEKPSKRQRSVLFTPRFVSATAATPTTCTPYRKRRRSTDAFPMTPTTPRLFSYRSREAQTPIAELERGSRENSPSSSHSTSEEEKREKVDFDLSEPETDSGSEGDSESAEEEEEDDDLESVSSESGSDEEEEEEDDDPEIQINIRNKGGFAFMPPDIDGMDTTNTDTDETDKKGGCIIM
eukprot:TRINITY_DN1365_c1_g1_i3.p1 TRINITY_DN1365_c1_g1~~TRINITY_DN1365_c1_g1_i3.p1  ORF type:complete len:644 (-),score=156.19 TRINITY_DN1365_c1_g1_i3:511-2256(-)